MSALDDRVNLERREHQAPAPLVLALLLVAPSPSAAHQDTARRSPPPVASRLVGTVKSALNGQPLKDVMIVVVGMHRFDVTDSTGAFALSGLRSGDQTVRILYGDSLSYEKAVRLQPGKTVTLSVLLDAQAQELTPIVVEARSLLAELSLAGFYERKRTGWGRFYTYDQLERRASRSLRTLLMDAGVTVWCGNFTCYPVRFSGAHLCALSLYLDGMRLQPEDMDTFRTDELAGVEVYPHGLDVPLQFRRGYEDCGAVLMWSRR
jgi:hypothetical protein